jgi:hypothetical protein
VSAANDVVAASRLWEMPKTLTSVRFNLGSEAVAELFPGAAPVRRISGALTGGLGASNRRH